MNKQHVPLYLTILSLVFAVGFFCYMYWRLSPLYAPLPIEAPLVVEGVGSVRNVSDHHDGVFTRTDVDYPRFDGELAILNAPIERLLKDAIKEHDKTSAENWAARVKFADPKGSLPEVPAAKDRFPYHATWSLTQFDATRVSVLIQYDEFSGGAHGSEGMATFNYDLHAHKVITIHDMLSNDPVKLQKLSKNAIEALIEERKQTQHETVLTADELRWIGEGAGPKSENFQNFTIHGNRITFYFGQYQVGPYVIGMPRIELPFPLE